MLELIMTAAGAELSATGRILLGLGIVVLTWALFSYGLMRVLKKLSAKLKPVTRIWWAWIPGLRYAAFGDAVELEWDGAICGVLEAVSFVMSFFVPESIEESAGVVISLIQLILIVIFFIYRIRLFLQLTTVFGVRKSWVLLWLVMEWLAMLILGVGKRYQPRGDVKLTEEWEAGLAPAAIPGVGEAMHGHVMCPEGLSIDLRERTVRELNRKRYLLKDISLDIPNGSMVLLLGGSGSGKTTFVNAVIGYEQADATIWLNGSDVYKDYDRMKYRIGFVPQQNLVRANDTVRRTVTDAAQLRLPAQMPGKSKRGKIQEVMDLLGIAAGSDGLVGKKSGGQLRRISIAMELVTDPELFVLDEPDSGLDGVIAREIFQKLRGIADEGKIVIVITHTPDRVIDLFDKVIVLARDSGRVGRLAFYGSPEEGRAFFGKDSMEGIVMSVNRKEEGGDGMADEFVERYARLSAAREEASVNG